MSYQLHGEIHHIGEMKKVSENFLKKDVIIVTDKNTQYPQYVTVQFANTKVDLLDSFKEGQQVSIDFNLQGRLDKNDNQKSYNQLQGYKIQKV